jgi:hypothetical protein
MPGCIQQTYRGVIQRTQHGGYRSREYTQVAEVQRKSVLAGVWWIVGICVAVLILWVLYSLGNPRPA